jgi:hypothetical protein
LLVRVDDVQFGLEVVGYGQETECLPENSNAIGPEIVKDYNVNTLPTEDVQVSSDLRCESIGFSIKIRLGRSFGIGQAVSSPPFFFET